MALSCVYNAEHAAGHIASRNRLIKEREQLHEDVKNAGVVRTQEQIDAIVKRITDLEARINGFNDEVKRLNDEESKLIEESRPKDKEKAATDEFLNSPTALNDKNRTLWTDTN